MKPLCVPISRGLEDGCTVLALKRKGVHSSSPHSTRPAPAAMQGARELEKVALPLPMYHGQKMNRLQSCRIIGDGIVLAQYKNTGDMLAFGLSNANSLSTSALLASVGSTGSLDEQVDKHAFPYRLYHIELVHQRICSASFDFADFTADFLGRLITRHGVVNHLLDAALGASQTSREELLRHAFATLVSIARDRNELTSPDFAAKAEALQGRIHPGALYVDVVDALSQALPEALSSNIVDDECVASWSNLLRLTAAHLYLHSVEDTCTPRAVKHLAADGRWRDRRLVVTTQYILVISESSEVFGAIPSVDVTTLACPCKDVSRIFQLRAKDGHVHTFATSKLEEISEVEHDIKGHLPHVNVVKDVESQLSLAVLSQLTNSKEVRESLKDAKARRNAVTRKSSSVQNAFTSQTFEEIEIPQTPFGAALHLATHYPFVVSIYTRGDLELMRVVDLSRATHSTVSLPKSKTMTLSLILSDHGIYVLRDTHIVHFPRFAHLKNIPGSSEEAMETYQLSSTLAAFSINSRQAFSNVHGNFLMLTGPRRFVMINIKTGEVLSSLPVDESFKMPINLSEYSGRYAVAASFDTLCIYNVAQETRKWIECPARPTALCFYGGDVLFYGDSDGDIREINMITGNVKTIISQLEDSSPRQAGYMSADEAIRHLLVLDDHLVIAKKSSMFVMRLGSPRSVVTSLKFHGKAGKPVLFGRTLQFRMQSPDLVQEIWLWTPHFPSPKPSRSSKHKDGKMRTSTNGTSSSKSRRNSVSLRKTRHKSRQAKHKTAGGVDDTECGLCLLSYSVFHAQSIPVDPALAAKYWKLKYELLLETVDEMKQKLCQVQLKLVERNGDYDNLYENYTSIKHRNEYLSSCLDQVGDVEIVNEPDVYDLMTPRTRVSSTESLTSHSGYSDEHQSDTSPPLAQRGAQTARAIVRSWPRPIQRNVELTSEIKSPRRFTHDRSVSHGSNAGSTSPEHSQLSPLLERPLSNEVSPHTGSKLVTPREVALLRSRDSRIRLVLPGRESQSPRVNGLDLDSSRARLSSSEGTTPRSHGRKRSKSTEDLLNLYKANSIAIAVPSISDVPTSLKQLHDSVASLPRTHIDRFRQLYNNTALSNTFEQSLTQADVVLLRFYGQVMKMKEELQFEGLQWVRITQRYKSSGLVAGRTWQQCLYRTADLNDRLLCFDVSTTGVPSRLPNYDIVAVKIRNESGVFESDQLSSPGRYAWSIPSLKLVLAAATAEARHKWMDVVIQLVRDNCGGSMQSSEESESLSATPTETDSRVNAPPSSQSAAKPQTSHSLHAALTEIADTYLTPDRTGQPPLQLVDPFVQTQVEHRLANGEYSLSLFDPLLADCELILLPQFSHYLSTLQEQRVTTPLNVFSPRSPRV